MTFHPRNCLTLLGNAGAIPPTPIRLMDRSTLILISASGEAEYAASREDKDRIVAKFRPDEDLLLWAWAGSYRTDVFRLTEADLRERYMDPKRAAYLEKLKDVEARQKRFLKELESKKGKN